MAVPLDALKGKFDPKPQAKADRSTLQKPLPRALAPRQRVEDKEPLPDSPEIESALLASIFQQPEIGFSSFAQKEFFANPINRELFEAAQSFYVEKGQLDLIAFTSHLQDSGKLDKLGGVAPLTNLFIRPVASAMMDYYIGELRDKYVRRQIMLRSFALSSKAKDQDVGDVLNSMARNVEDLRKMASGLNGNSPTHLAPYLEADTGRDPDCLVGNRWIVLGGSTLWCGSPGIGKSSLIMQLILYWAKGETIFGLRPTRPLRSVLIQSENDFLDVSEQIQGIAHALAKIDGFSVGDLEDKIWIAQSNGLTGLRFLAYLETVLSTYKTDLLWIDPLFAYAGVDLMNAEKTGIFLREGLFPLAAKYHVSIQVAHHVSKFIRDPQTHEKLSDNEMQFLGFGTSEIQNAFRAVNILIAQQQHNLFKLSFSKRGERARARDPEGKITRSIYLKHSGEGICWMQTDEPIVDRPGKAKYVPEDVTKHMSVIDPLKVSELVKKVGERGMSRASFFRIWNHLEKTQKITETVDGWLLKSGEKSHESQQSQDPF